MLSDSIRVGQQVLISPAIPVDKFISKHAIPMLKGMKKIKMICGKKTRKPMTYNKGQFDSIQSEASSLVS